MRACEEETRYVHLRLEWEEDLKGKRQGIQDQWQMAIQIPWNPLESYNVIITSLLGNKPCTVKSRKIKVGLS